MPFNKTSIAKKRLIKKTRRLQYHPQHGRYQQIRSRSTSRTTRAKKSFINSSAGGAFKRPRIPEIDKKDKQGNTALIKACKQYNVNIALDLINRGANLDLTDNNGNTALMITCSSLDRLPGVAMALIRAEANLNIKSSRGGFNALHVLIVFNTSNSVVVDEVALEMIKNINLETVNDEGENALDLALRGKFVVISTALIISGLEPNSPIDEIKQQTYNEAKAAAESNLQSFKNAWGNNEDEDN